MLITIASVMVMAGCGNAIPELTEDQRAQVVEYSAMLLLKYDKNYRATMLDQDEVYKQEEKIDANAAMRAEVARQKEILEQQALEESQGDSGDDEQGGGEYVAPAPVYADIDEVLGLSGVDIEFDHYTVCKSYPELTEDNSWQGVCYASGSNSLVVFTFNITNIQDSPYDSAF